MPIFVAILYICMSRDNKKSASPPPWFVILLVVLLLPLVFLVMLPGRLDAIAVYAVNPDIAKFAVYAMPLYAVASQVFSYKIYSQWPALAWVMQFLLILAYLMCAWLLILSN